MLCGGNEYAIANVFALKHLSYDWKCHQSVWLHWCLAVSVNIGNIFNTSGYQCFSARIENKL